MFGRPWPSQESETTPGPAGLEGDRLDRILVAGLLLEVFLAGPALPPGPGERRRLVKARLKQALVSHLAGRVSLDHFRVLVRGLDRWFSQYYPFLVAARPAPARELPPAPGPPGRALREELLEEWLREHQGLLPRRRQGKIKLPGLREFLQQTWGGWFRLRDFARHFGLDRKTAWEYLQKLAAAGLLTHNRRPSSQARYALDPRFLAVAARILRPAVAAALGALPEAVADSLGDFLIATGGEAFWEEAWEGDLPPARRQEILARLTAVGLLQAVAQSGASRLFRLGPRFRRESPGKTMVLPREVQGR